MPTYGHMNKDLTGSISRCPHCSVASPNLLATWRSNQPLPRSASGSGSVWAVYYCTSCGGAILAKGQTGVTNADAVIVAIYPTSSSVDEAIPDSARRYLTQALETLHAPDAAAVMAGSAVDAMLKQLNYDKGSLYERIDKAVADNVITKAMGEWAHWVRLGSNRPRHADKDKPHVTEDEARQSVEFAAALGYFLFVLTSRVTEGIAKAEKLSG